MKIVLLVLSGETGYAHTLLQNKHPAAAIETITRDDIDTRSSRDRVRFLRMLRPKIFAVMTERLAWQRGQNAFSLLGALAGAHTTVILDSHGGWNQETRASALAKSPARLTREAARSATAIRRAEKELSKLEVAIETRDRAWVRSSSTQTAKPKVVYLRSSPGPGTQAGGAASHINGFINAAIQIGVPVSLISNDEIAGLDQDKVATKIIPPEPLGSTRAAFDIYNNLRFSKPAVEEIERAQPDLIYQRYARFSWAGVAASLRTKRPLFLEYNGSEVWVGRHWDRVDKLDLLARYERLNLKAAARIFVVSEVERRNLLHAGVASKKIVVNPNGVDVEKFKPGVNGDATRRQFGVASHQVLVGFVGTFGPWHGVEVLARAIAEVPRTLPLHFLLIGSGALRGRVEEILRQAEALNRVTMMGAIPHHEVPRLLDACDILTSPHVPLDAGAEFFGSPTKLFEYMAMGKAIVASRLGQIGEVLEHEKTALLVEPGNVHELTGAILRLTESLALREALGKAARRRAIEQHTWIYNAQRVIDEYASV
jgi:glycosyltransferase involved in cell wall biosynthesis